MPDYLLDLSGKPLARKLVKQFKLPIPLPEILDRDAGPWSPLPLSERTFAVGGSGPLPVRSVIEEAGGRVRDEGSVTGVVYDASDATSSDLLRGIYEFLHGKLRSLATNGRVLILGRAPDSVEDPEAAATQEALSGFVKSLAKELGRKGATCQLVYVSRGADDAAALAMPLRYFLSTRSAFITGQVMRLTSGAKHEFEMPVTPLLHGRTALVTGAARGIGAETARRLAHEGARVFVVDRPQEREVIEALAHEIQGFALAIDLKDDDAPQKIAAAVETEAGRLDILVNNAGITRDKTLARMTCEAWDDVLAINLKAALRLTEAFIGGRRDGLGQKELIHLMGPGGRIIMLSSIGGIAGNAGQTNYAAAKAGLIGYVRAMAPKLAKRGITINALAPGFIETRMTEAMPIAMREVARRFNTLNQAGKPGDVADAAVFFASPGAFAVTGTVLRVCGQNLIGA